MSFHSNLVQHASFMKNGQLKIQIDLTIKGNKLLVIVQRSLGKLKGHTIYNVFPFKFGSTCLVYEKQPAENSISLI